MRVGLIGRADPTGLGSMTIDFCNELEVDRAIIIERDGRGKTEPSLVRCPRKLVVSHPDPESLSWLLDGCEVLVGFETFYDDIVIPEARRRGVKTVMFPMWECSPFQVHTCDVLFAVSDADAAEYPQAERIRWPMRRIFTRGTTDCGGGFIKHIPGGLHDRNNAFAVSCAIQEINDDFIEVHGIRSKNLISWDHHEQVDRERIYAFVYGALVHLQAFDGLSLPMLEASSCGLPVVVLNIPGFQEFPEQMRVEVGSTEEHEIGCKTITYHRPDPAHLRQVLVELATGTRKAEPGPEPATWDEFRPVWERVRGRICNGDNGL